MTRRMSSSIALLLAASFMTVSCSKEAEPKPMQERVKITVHMIGGTPLPDPKEDPIKQELDKKLGIDLAIRTFFPEDYANQVKMGMATDSNADLLYIGSRQEFVHYSKQQLLLDLSPYLDLLEPTLQLIGKERLQLAEVGGGVYGLPRTVTAYQYSYWIRQDWLEKLKLNVPRTTDEFLTVVKAMAERDPDGNGRRDTYGFSGRPNQALGPLFGAFGTTYPGSFYMKDNELINSLYDPATPKALSYIRSIFETKGVDPGIVSNTNLQHKEKALQGQLGLFYFNWPNWYQEEYLSVNADARWIPIDPPQGPNGDRYAYGKNVSESILVIPRSVGNDKVKLNKIIQLLNYVSSPEGNKLVMYGLAGKHYTETNGTVAVHEILKETLGYAYQLTGRDEMGYLRTKFPEREADFTMAARQPFIPIYDGLIQPPDGFRLDDAKRYIEQELWRFVYGQRPLDSYDGFLQELEEQFQYESGYVASARQQIALRHEGKPEPKTSEE
ncbi:putative aldouronate transport system substrate-binding protein [Paenibacillus sp. UNCCL117]|nr:putative aldouronate transport system substrate-binding protein [Paenibacillus sp. cl123]SFW28921.1 putative aldouronate transport system substrate-binding protein [Paenibacillus sp. UNCCL117]